MKIQKAKMELVELDGQDVITASTGGGVRSFTLSGLYDGEGGNASFIDSDGKFSFYSDKEGSLDVLFECFRDGTLDDDLPVSEETAFRSLDGDNLAVSDVAFADDRNDHDDFNSKFNGPYIWVEDHFQRIQQ